MNKLFPWFVALSLGFSIPQLSFGDPDPNPPVPPPGPAPLYGEYVSGFFNVYDPVDNGRYSFFIGAPEEGATLASNVLLAMVLVGDYLVVFDKEVQGFSYQFVPGGVANHDAVALDRFLVSVLGREYLSVYNQKQHDFVSEFVPPGEAFLFASRSGFVGVVRGGYWMVYSGALNEFNAQYVGEVVDRPIQGLFLNVTGLIHNSVFWVFDPKRGFRSKFVGPGFEGRAFQLVAGGLAAVGRRSAFTYVLSTGEFKDGIGVHAP